jgi:hypothetical protein
LIDKRGARLLPVGARLLVFGAKRRGLPVLPRKKIVEYVDILMCVCSV